MARYLTPSLLCLFLLGCHPASPGPARQEGDSGSIDYSGWKALTPQPVRVTVSDYFDCVPPPPTARPARAHGPHLVPAIKLFANPLADAHFESRSKDAFPAGAVLVKEKWANEGDRGPVAYAAMIKREPGYDAEHGDWEYVYADLSAGGKVQRGRLESCISCHGAAAKTDYLFLSYLGGEQDRGRSP